MTAPARLGLLLPWLNGEFDENHWEAGNPEPVAVWTDYTAIRRALKTFVRAFDGSADAAHVMAEPDDTVDALDDDAIGDLAATLGIFLEQGFGDNPHDQGLAIRARSLRFAVRSVGRPAPSRRGSVVSGGVAAQRQYRATGAYVLRAQGPLKELVPFLLMTLLTAPNMVAVKHCQRHGCSHFVTESGRRGAPQKFCSPACGAFDRETNPRRKRRK